MIKFNETTSRNLEYCLFDAFRSIQFNPDAIRYAFPYEGDSALAIKAEQKYKAMLPDCVEVNSTVKLCKSFTRTYYKDIFTQIVDRYFRKVLSEPTRSEFSLLSMYYVEQGINYDAKLVSEITKLVLDTVAVNMARQILDEDWLNIPVRAYTVPLNHQIILGDFIITMLDNSRNHSCFLTNVFYTDDSFLRKYNGNAYWYQAIEQHYSANGLVSKEALAIYKERSVSGTIYADLMSILHKTGGEKVSDTISATLTELKGDKTITNISLYDDENGWHELRFNICMNQIVQLATSLNLDKDFDSCQVSFVDCVIRYNETPTDKIVGVTSKTCANMDTGFNIAIRKCFEKDVDIFDKAFQEIPNDLESLVHSLLTY